jgi:CHAD domain-containing protein
LTRALEARSADAAGGDAVRRVTTRITSPGRALALRVRDDGGQRAVLYDIALDLLRAAPVRLERRDRRRGAAKAVSVTAVHAAAIDLDPSLSGDEALRRIGIACLDQVLGNEPAIAADVAEGIHQMRVAVRRLRAILSAFGAMLPEDQRRWASAELRWLADALSAARNVDVFLQALLAPAQAALAATDGMAALAAAAEQRRLSAYAQAKKAVGSRRYTALLLRLLRWFESCGWRDATVAHDLDQPIDSLAAPLLDRRLRTVKRRGKGFAGQSAMQRHRLRIALKKLRYATEVLAALYPHADRDRFEKRLKRLQDDLGDANDVRVGRNIVADLAGRSGHGVAVADAGQAVLDWHERRLTRREHKLRKHLGRLLDAGPFWRPEAD